MKIVFFGTPKEVVPVLENLTKHFDVVAVVTTPDQRAGRKQLMTASPVKIFAQQQKISVITPQQLNNETFEQLRTYEPDIFVVAAYGKLIPHEILSIPKHGAINIHPSLLPKYRGPTPIQTTILNGDEQSGITFMKMDEQMDHGPLLAQYLVSLKKTDTFASVMNDLFAQSAKRLPQAITDYIGGKIKPQPQDDSKATYTQKITKEDGYIDLSSVENGQQEALDKKIRAYYPWPTLWTKEKIHGREVVIKFLPNSKLQVEGKNPLSIKDFLNGYPEMREKLAKVI